MKRLSVAAVSLLLLLSVLTTVCAQSEATHIYRKAIYVVYPDGSVNVTYVLNPLAAPSDIVVPVEAPPILALAVDPSGVYLPIDFNESSIVITVYEAVPLTVSYITLNMTSKIGEQWVLRIRPPCTAYVILPENAIPVEFTPMPKHIMYVDNDLAFVFPPGSVQIKYMLLPKTSLETRTRAPTTSTQTTTIIPVAPIGAATTSVHTLPLSATPAGTTTASVALRSVPTTHRSTAVSPPSTATTGGAVLSSTAASSRAISTSHTPSPTSAVLTPSTTKAVSIATQSGTGANYLLVVGGVACIAVAITLVVLYRRGRGMDRLSTSSSSLDDRDRAILESLRGGPKTASELMKETGIPRTPLYRRLKKLTELGLVEPIEENGVRKYRLK